MSKNYVFLQPVEEKPAKTVLTDDEDFERIARKEYDFFVIYYNDIRNATINKGGKIIIPKSLLLEPKELVQEIALFDKN